MPAMSKTVKFIPEQERLLLQYQPSGNFDQGIVNHKLVTEGKVTIRRTFTFNHDDLIYSQKVYESDDDELTFVFGLAEGDYYRISRRILGLKNDLFLSRQMQLSHKTFIANRDISIFGRIDDLVDEPIVVGGNVENAIPLESFDELLANFPTTTEVDLYARARVTGVLKDYLGTMSDAQIKLDRYLNKKKSIRTHSKIDFIKDYETKKFEYVRDEISAMLQSIESVPDAFKERDWQRQIVELLLLIFPKYVAVLENVHIKRGYVTRILSLEKLLRVFNLQRVLVKNGCSCCRNYWRFLNLSSRY